MVTPDPFVSEEPLKLAYDHDSSEASNISARSLYLHLIPIYLSETKEEKMKFKGKHILQRSL